MKFMHLSDLHLGKRVNEFSMLEDQAAVLEEILRIAEREAPDGLLLAGDVYDKPVPPAEAVEMFDGFLVRLSEMRIPVLVVSGNHDSPERLAFAARLIRQSGIHISPVYDGACERVTLRDEWGDVDVFLLPFVKPVNVRRAFPEEEIASYTDAVRVAVSHMPLRPGVRSVLVTHQFVTGAARSDSEEVSVGGADNVDASVFDPFAYVALGHIHSPQSLADGRVRYCGSPLKYSFSESRQTKSVTCVTLDGAGEISVSTIPLVPIRDMREIRGSYMELSARANYAGTNTDDYLGVTLTDEEFVQDAAGKLRAIYPNLMKLQYDNLRSRATGEIAPAEEKNLTPQELFSALYQAQNNAPMTDEMRDCLADAMRDIWEGEA